MKKYILFGTFLFSCYLLAQTSIRDVRAADDASAQSQSGPGGPVPVVVVQVSPDSEEVVQDFPGRVSAFRIAEVRARVTGIIEERVFDEGSHVESGQALFKIEHKSLKATLRARQADVAVAEANFNLSGETLKRYKGLLSKEAVSLQEYDTYFSQFKQSEAQVEQAKANLEIARINLQYATVTAPISGRIDKALVSEGALTNADTTQLASIEQIDKVYIDFTRASSDLVRTNQSKNGSSSDSDDKNIEVILSDGSSYPEKGKLAFSSQSVDQATGAISMRMVIENPNFTLLPGMFVRVKVPVASTDEVIKVPQKAVYITPSGAEVYTVEDGKLIAVKVELGPMTGGDWVVRSGLQSGVRVVVSDISIVRTIPGATFIGMTSAELQAASSAQKEQ